MAEHLASPDDIAAIGDGERLALAMVGNEDRDPVVTELDDDLLDRVDGDRIDAGERLVEKDDPRVGDEAAGDLEPPLLAAGERPGPRLADVLDRELFEELLAAIAALLASHSYQLHDRQQILLGGELAEDALLLGEIAHAAVAGALEHRPMGDLLVIEEDAPGVGDHHPAGHAETRRLAGAVGPEKADDLPLLDVEIDTVDHSAPAVILHQAFDLQQRHRDPPSAGTSSSKGRLSHRPHPAEVGP